MKKASAFLFSLFYITCASAENAENGCSVSSLIQILNNKPLSETTDKLCSYYYKNSYEPEELDKDTCKNLVEPCAVDKEDESKKFQLKLTEFKLASQLKALDEDYNREIADLEFFDSLKQNYSEEQLKKIPQCSDTIKSQLLDTCPSMKEIPKPALIEAQHFLYTAENDKLALTYIEKTLARAKLDDELLKAEPKDIPAKKAEIAKSDKDILELVSRIQNAKFQNGYITENYSNYDSLSEKIREIVTERDQSEIYLSIFNFRNDSRFFVDGNLEYVKDKVLNSWWSRFDGSEESPQKKALENLLQENKLTPKTPAAEIKKLVDKVRFQMAIDVAKEACNEASLKRHRDINSKGGLCKILESVPATNKHLFSLEEYLQMHPEEEKTLLSDQKYFEETKNAFNKNMSLWLCSHIAPSTINNAEKHKTNPEDWMKVAKNFSKKSKENYDSVGEKINKAFEKHSGVSLNASDILNNVKKSKDSSSLNSSKSEVSSTQKGYTANKIAEKISSSTAQQHSNFTQPFANFASSNNTNAPVKIETAQPTVGSSRLIKDDEEGRKEIRKPAKKIKNDDSNEGVINSLKDEIEKLKKTETIAAPSADKETQDLVSENKRSNHGPLISDKSESTSKADRSVNESQSQRAFNGPSQDSVPSKNNAENAPAKSHSAESNNMLLNKKLADELTENTSVLSNPKESDLISMAEKMAGKPFFIQENGEYIKVIPLLDDKGSIVFKEGKMIFKKLKIKKNEKSKLLEQLRLTKEVERIPTRKHDLDELLKKSSK